MQFFFSFTLYHAYSKVGRGNLALRHSVTQYAPIFSRHCVLNGGTQNRIFALIINHLCPECESNPQPSCCSHTLVLLRHDSLICKYICKIWLYNVRIITSTLIQSISEFICSILSFKNKLFFFNYRNCFIDLIMCLWLLKDRNTCLFCVKTRTKLRTQS